MTARVLVLISGNGSNLQALIDKRQSGGFDICAVISNEPEAFVLQRADKVGIATIVLNHRDFCSRVEFDRALMRHIDELAPDLLVLAGFMRILSAEFVHHYSGRILNIHPSLLPDYRGTQTHDRVLEAGETEHGVSVHFVTEELDGGPVILQAVVPVLPGDSKETLTQRVSAQEHIIYPEVVSWFSQGRLCMKDNTAWLDNTRLPAQGIRRRLV